MLPPLTKDFYSYAFSFLSVYMLVGIGFGVFASQNDIPAWLIVSMAFLFYSGAGQLLAVGLLVAGAHPGEIIGAVTLLNIRHLFYGINVYHLIPKRGLSRLYSIFALTDETWALTSHFPHLLQGKRLVSVFFGFHMTWGLSCLAGVVLGTLLPEINKIAFLLTYAFAIMAVDIYLKNRAALPYVYAAVGYAVSVLIVGIPELYAILLIGFALTVATEVWLFLRRTKR